LLSVITAPSIFDGCLTESNIIYYFKYYNTYPEAYAPIRGMSEGQMGSEKADAYEYRTDCGYVHYRLSSQKGTSI